MQYIGADLFSAFAILAFKAEFYFVPRIGRFLSILIRSTPFGIFKFIQKIWEPVLKSRYAGPQMATLEQALIVFRISQSLQLFFSHIELFIILVIRN